jgi:hypothetical protein
MCSPNLIKNSIRPLVVELKLENQKSKGKEENLTVNSDSMLNKMLKLKRN